MSDLGKPISISFLVSLIIPKNLDVHLASSVVAGHKIVMSCCSVVKLWKVGFSADILAR